MRNMNYVMDALRKKEAEKKIPVIKMEIDYELLTLYDALQAKDTTQKILSTEKLVQLHAELQKISE